MPLSDTTTVYQPITIDHSMQICGYNVQSSMYDTWYANMNESNEEYEAYSGDIRSIILGLFSDHYCLTSSSFVD